jgi:hypothetical protein
VIILLVLESCSGGANLESSAIGTDKIIKLKGDVEYKITDVSFIDSYKHHTNDEDIIPKEGYVFLRLDCTLIHGDAPIIGAPSLDYIYVTDNNNTRYKYCEWWRHSSERVYYIFPVLKGSYGFTLYMPDVEPINLDQ